MSLARVEDREWDAFIAKIYSRAEQDTGWPVELEA